MEELKISLAAARVNAGLTQEAVAKELGISNKTVVNWESGKIKPKPATVYALAHLYKIPVDNIFLP